MKVDLPDSLVKSKIPWLTWAGVKANGVGVGGRITSAGPAGTGGAAYVSGGGGIAAVARAAALGRPLVEVQVGFLLGAIMLLLSESYW